MDGRVESAVFLPRARFEELRAPRPFEAACRGLWSVGALEGLTQAVVAIVGTRAATPYGTRLAHAFALALGRAGCCILSGLALGIDAAARRGALEARTPTIGVLGCGHENFFPPRNRDLADRMLAGGGAVLSPFEPGAPALPYQFLERNGIVAALADVVVVIEAPSRSGALNTASWAAGRIPVLAVPGDVDRPHVQGCLALIRDGAMLARSPEDVLEALGIRNDPARGTRPRPPSDPLERELLAALRGSDGTLDALIAATGANAAAILASLAMLEIDGRVESRGGGTYATLDPL